MQARYFTADVFTDRRFGGNQLAVFPDARGIPEELMLTITREFNYSETTFVLPPSDPRNTRRVRIFTPGGEVPFAGHPTVGTAYVLAHAGEVKLHGPETRIVFEEGVGPVPVTISARDGVPAYSRLSVAKLPERGPLPPEPGELARALSLDEGDLVGGEWAAEVWSCGLPFLFIPLRNRNAVRRARVRLDAWEAALSHFAAPEMFVFALDPEREGSDIRARMFAPGLSVPEDPATGSACAALAGYLAARSPGTGEHLRWVVEQGFEMGRPSVVEVEAERRNGAVTAVRVGGSSVIVCEGVLHLDT